VALLVAAYLPMPGSWSERKKIAMEGRIHRQKPDYDNIAKAVGDALFQDDSIIGTGACTKFWARAADARTEITVLFIE
jgi:Holliday junction resolvase RusA-like endonuclease